MNRLIYSILVTAALIVNFNLYGQNNVNCFLDDFQLKTAEIPSAVNAVKPDESASVSVTIQGDTLGKISKYVFGNAIAAWAGAHDDPIFVEGVKTLAPTLIRFPGGSWSDGYFWNGLPSDLPDSIYDGTTYNTSTQTAEKIKFSGQTGKGGWQTTPDQYYTLRRKTNVDQGLITINYGYARYGTSEDPVAKAAHLAAGWVRYDKGATKFWEIGNENGGPWEYGWMIDTTMNLDGQPQIISGELYGKHFKVFVDSMKAAAAEIGATIYIGGQVVINGPTSWNFVDRTWNEGFFREVGDYADFYVIHNYFSTSTNVNEIIRVAQTDPKANMDYLKQDFLDKNAYSKPVALTEYNLGSGTVTRAASFINGMQAVVLICELIKNNFGLGARWLLISGEETMFYGGSDAKYLYHPHPDFYYLHYLPKFYGDHAISAISSNEDILCYASKFSSGETGVVIVNKGNIEQLVGIDTKALGVGQKYYIYSFRGGADNGDFSQNVYINGYGPSPYHWGPYDKLSNLPARSYLVGDEVKLISPARSVQMIMIEGGADSRTAHSFNLFQNYPNPFNLSTCITYELRTRVFVRLKVYDVLGREVETLVSEYQDEGEHPVMFNGRHLPSGVYFYQLEAGANCETRKFLLLK